MHTDDLRLTERSLGAYLGGGVDDSGFRLALRPMASRVEPEAAEFTQISTETTRTGPHESCRKLEHVPTSSAHVQVYRGQSAPLPAIFSVPYERIFLVEA